MKKLEKEIDVLGQDTSSRNNNKFHKAIPIDLKIKVGSEEFILGTLSFNLNKDEMSWHFNVFKKKQVNLNTGEYTFPFEHLTFHGNVRHIKLSKGRLTKPTTVGKYSVFFPSLEEDIVLVEEFSLNGSEKHCLAKESNFKNSTSQVLANFKRPIDFSLMMVLIPTGCPTNYFMEEAKFYYKNKNIKLSDFVTSNYPVGRIICFNKFDLLIFIVPGVRDISKIEKKPLGSFRILNYQKPLGSICEIVKELGSKLPSFILF